VWTNPKNQVIGDRALAETADEVARFGRVLIHELREGGIAACAKHFPGHGDTIADSHEELPIVEHPRRRLDEVELVPFPAAIAEDGATIMAAHVLVPEIDADSPASLSSTIVTGILRNELGYGGLAICDDLGMKAISETSGLAESSVEAIDAGNDMVLLCNST